MKAPVRLAAITALALSCSSIDLAAYAGTEPAPTVTVNIDPQPMDKALSTFAQQTGLQLLMRADAVAVNVTAPRLVGTYTAREALERLLANTELRYKFIDARTVAIRASKGKDEVGSGTSSSEEQAHPSARGTNNDLRLAQSESTHKGTSGSLPAENDQSPAGMGADKLAVQEVIVTATKRAERMQDVPLSIAVVSGEDIARRGVIGMEDYLRSIPGVNEIDNGARSNAIVIRGIATSPEFENGNTGITVASYFDETPITGAAARAGGIDIRPVDIERIEVLRGPQGTTFGDAALGGAMRILPAKPKLDRYSGKVAAAYSNTSGSGADNSMLQGVVNLALVPDRFAVRAVGYRYEDSGIYRNVIGSDAASIALADSWNIGNDVRGFLRNHYGQMVTTGGRLAALWQLSEKSTLSANYLTQRIEQDGNPGTISGASYETIRFPIARSARLRGEEGEASDTKIDLANLVFNYDLGWAALTSVGSWIEGGAAWALDAAGALGLPLSLTIPSDTDSFKLEARLASQLDGPVQFLGGVFYQDEDGSFSNTFRTPDPPATNPFGNPMFRSSGTNHLEQRAVFGEISYRLTDKLTAAVGGRYFEYEKEDTLLLEGPLAGVAFGAGIPSVARGRDDGSTLKASISYKPTEDSLLYASWAQGFRLGPPDGPGLTAFANQCDTDNDGVVDGTTISLESTRHVNSDFLDSYELGTKFALLERRMAVNAAVYHMQWNGLPVTTFPSSGCTGVSYIANIGSATSDGLEIQATFLAGNGLKLDFGGGYTKAELARPGLGAPAGARLPGSPKVSANFAAQYDFEIAGHKVFVRADSFYSGDFYGSILELPITKAGEYVKVDASAGVVLGNLSVDLFVRNLTNEDAFTWQGVSNTASGYSGFQMRPRTVGIQFGYSLE